MRETKTRIIEATERLVTSRSPEDLTIRQITEEAGVNLAAINYHFGSKEGLANELILRLITPLKEERIRLLEDAEKAVGGKPVPLETIIQCFFRPISGYIDEKRERKNVIIGVSRLYDDKSLLDEQCHRNLKDEITKYRHALVNSLPDVSEKGILLYLALMYSTTQAILSNSVREQLSISFGFEMDKTDMIAEIIAFFIVGFKHLSRRGNNP